ncbi:Rraga [Symbiodinium sp. CCMP2592]|nr:Rraga [Symbiodinium sp. CCMP2592]
MKGKPQQAVIVVIGTKLREELLLISLLIPTAATDMRADFCTEVFAVDASDWGDAVCSSRVPVRLARELGRQCLSKGVWTRLLSPFKARARGHGVLDPNEELPGGAEDSFRIHPLWSLLATALKFRVRWKRASKRRRHINIGELRSFLKAERCGMQAGKSSRMLIGGDSQVALGALLKGRSSSASLNRELQKSLPYYIGKGLQPHYMYYPTAINPSDAPTRDREVPEPTEDLPSWWHLACEGKFEEMDRWLEARSADPFSLSGLPSLDELRKTCASEVTVQLRFGHLRKFKKLRELLQEGKQLGEDAGVASGSSVFPFPSSTVVESSLSPFASTGTFVWPKGVDKQQCKELPGCIDLCSGNMGYAQDLVIGEVQNEIRGILQSVRVAALSASPGSGGSFSLASSSGCRTAGHPLGAPRLGPAQSARVTRENKLVEFLLELCWWCYKNSVPFWLENPQGSKAWQLEPVRQLQACPGVGFWKVDFCAFGAPWKKRTRVLTSTHLAGQETTCPGCSVHHRLRERSPHGRLSWTKLAENFPKGLSLVLAMFVAGALGDRPDFKRLDACSCSRSLGLRVGEASHPGPRRPTAETRATRRAGQSLGQVALVEPQTQALEERLWSEFVAWVDVDCSLETAEHLTSVSATVAPLLREYGDELFQIGSSLSYFRHLLAFAQRKFPDFRMHGRICWDAVTRWEQLEPLEHRKPLPAALCRAMVALALAWEWPRFALVLLLAFEGIMIAEMLNAYRLDLVLPVDLMSDNCEQLFIRIGAPKTKRRGGGRKQHATVKGRELSAAATAVFAELSPTEKLYPLSSQSFRRRWGALLSHLHVSPELNLTPAGIRGGGAIQAYQAGLSVTDLLWKMRLQHVHTLQHYLQELAAESVLSQLSQEILLGFFDFFDDSLQHDSFACENSGLEPFYLRGFFVRESAELRLSSFLLSFEGCLEGSLSVRSLPVKTGLQPWMWLSGEKVRRAATAAVSEYLTCS